ncbi:hypothetical protein EV421DRAFT_1710086 [Armillaria borealis]|uniref:Uncharacterized protein n=1 Tax=Armillaria borealis TaxID=47425 RepID=A0AA39JN57_9AGAR|nr:hypothetical protein EV421DRAFT_1710086 [Armillaria borealis]
MAGRAKQSALTNGSTTVKNLKLENPNLDRLLSTLFNAFGARYGSEFYLGVLKTHPKKAQYLLDRLQDHEWFLKTITAALKDRTAWPKNDPSRENSMQKVDATANRKRKSERDGYKFSRPTQKTRYINEAAN